MPDAIKDAIVFPQSETRAPRSQKPMCAASPSVSGISPRQRVPVSLNKPEASQVCSKAGFAHSSSVT